MLEAWTDGNLPSSARLKTPRLRMASAFSSRGHGSLLASCSPLQCQYGSCGSPRTGGLTSNDAMFLQPLQNTRRLNSPNGTVPRSGAAFFSYRAFLQYVKCPVQARALIYLFDIAAVWEPMTRAL
jgi:hypothetical protein